MGVARNESETTPWLRALRMALGLARRWRKGHRVAALLAFAGMIGGLGVAPAAGQSRGAREGGAEGRASESRAFEDRAFEDRAGEDGEGETSAVVVVGS